LVKRGPIEGAGFIITTDSLHLVRSASWRYNILNNDVPAPIHQYGPLMNIKIYHNPRCSKSRQTLHLIKDKGIEPDVVEYLKDPPDHKTLKCIIDMLGLEPRQLMRKKEPEYQTQQLDNPDLTQEQLIAAMINHPKLIERPIVIKDGKAIIGRPPEKVLDIL
jgi:arsenate reductase